MSQKVRNRLNSDSPEYIKGYNDGMRQAFEESELDAYYTGVGYAKKSAGDKHIGFNNDEERRQFEKGILNKDRHFGAYQTERITFWDRLFGLKPSTSRMIRTSENEKYRSKVTSKERKKASKIVNKKRKAKQKAIRKAGRKAIRNYKRSRKKRTP